MRPRKALARPSNLPAVRALCARLLPLALTAPLALGLGACASQHNDQAPPGTSLDATSRDPVDSSQGDTGSTASCDSPEMRGTEACGGNAPPPDVPRPRAPEQAHVVPPSYAPYGVSILGGESGALPTFHKAGRTYVLGSLGTRYRVRITNPTARRIEAVISIDGLDALDGKAADVTKSGYLVPAYGEVIVEGFRTSLDDVATFRFSSVSDSYAGRKGVARNVGVIGVAFFPEREVVARRPAPVAPYPMPTDDLGRDRYEGESRSAGGATPAQASPPPASASAPPASPSKSGADGALAGNGPAGRAASEAAPKRERAGLGTEFGENRSSHVEEVEFHRQDASHPSHVSEVRYNDRAGLLAMGVIVDPPRPPSEVTLRETADPFPATRFAAPPPSR